MTSHRTRLDRIEQKLASRSPADGRDLAAARAHIEGAIERIRTSENYADALGYFDEARRIIAGIPRSSSRTSSADAIEAFLKLREEVGRVTASERQNQVAFAQACAQVSDFDL